MGQRKLTSKSIIHADLHKPNNKLVNAQLQHFWCTNKPQANMDSQDSPQLELGGSKTHHSSDLGEARLTIVRTWGKQDSPQLGLGGSHQLPPYSILCAWPWDQHPNVILSQDSQVRVPKFPKIGTPATLGSHNFVCRSLIEVRSKAKLQLSSKAFQ